MVFLIVYAVLMLWLALLRTGCVVMWYVRTRHQKDSLEEAYERLTARSRHPSSGRPAGLRPGDRRDRDW